MNGDWLSWRNQGLGSSDAPVVMGVSPYKTLFQLWQEKMGLSEPKKSNWAMERGIKLEPVARANYELINNIDMKPALREHKEYPFIRASLDGLSPDGSIILEIKCPGKEDHALATTGKVPDKYYPQLQHQLLVTGAKKVHYYSFDGEKGVLVEVYPDTVYIDRLVFELVAFWGLVENKTPPDLSDEDFEQINNKDKIEMALEYSRISLQLKSLQKEQDELKAKILAGIGHPNFVVGKLKVATIYRKGNIEYSNIPALKCLDLEPYRKKGYTYHNFTIKE